MRSGRGRRSRQPAQCQVKRRGVGRRPHWTVVGALVAVLGVAGCGQSGASGSRGAEVASSFGRLAGYVWHGHVRAVAAAWTVPGILDRSPDGHASTWIGAQAPGSASPGPFIQVGITEDRFGPTSLGAHPRLYQAFWSATQLKFHR